LHHQSFYQNLQKFAVKSVVLPDNSNVKTWADIGCSTGLITRLARQLNYQVFGYDKDGFSIILANIFAFRYSNIIYQKQDFNTLSKNFDVVSAASLLSVTANKNATLIALIKLLKDQHSVLVLIEPTPALTLNNVYKLIDSIKDFWHYKGLFIWAKVRQGKNLPDNFFESFSNTNIRHYYRLNKMLKITHIQKV
jgi:2-polyprenyl-3-methyl-5-hydroxy-6-metoxy-1,4-benzoquinol methylase